MTADILPSGSVQLNGRAHGLVREATKVRTPPGPHTDILLRMDAKLNRPLQKLHDQVKGIEDVRSSVSAMCEAFSNLLIEAKDNPEHVESLALQIGVNAAEWANACVQNTAAVQERRVSTAGQVC